MADVPNTEMAIPPSIFFKLKPNQRQLYRVIASYYPKNIRRTLESTPHVHSPHLHRLYNILKAFHSKHAEYLPASLQGVKEPAAEEMVNDLAGVGFHHLGDTDNDDQAPVLFYSAERRNVWVVVCRLFLLGYLGSANLHSPVKEDISDFATLQMLYNLDLSDEKFRLKLGKSKDLRDPTHDLYHVEGDAAVGSFLRRMVPLVHDAAYMHLGENSWKEKDEEETTLCPPYSET